MIRAVILLSLVLGTAACALPVLVTGETGTGKEGAARMLHDLGARRCGPFLALNCAALPETLLEAELFGTVRGAYTGASGDRPGLYRSADGGTLLLDELGELPLHLQASLLRFLDDGSVRPVGGTSSRIQPVTPPENIAAIYETGYAEGWQ